MGVCNGIGGLTEEFIVLFPGTVTTIIGNMEVRQSLYTTTAALCQIPLVFLFAYWFWRLPVPGIAVTVLGGAAVVMAVRANRFTRVEELLWIVIAVALCVIEVKAIRHDRAQAVEEQERVHKEENQKFAALLDEGRKHFEATISQSQTEFTTTMNRSSAIMHGISDTIKTTTGGDSFAYVRFLTSTEQGQAAVVITQQGKYPLKELDFTITDDTKMKEIMHEANKRLKNMSPENGHPPPLPDFVLQSINAIQVEFRVPYLPPDRSQIVGTIPLPENDSNDFTIGFSGGNGYWNERLHLRRINGNWVQALSVIGPTAQSVKHPFEYADQGYPEKKGFARRDWPLVSKKGKKI